MHYSDSRFIFTLEGVETTVSAGAKATTIPPHARHTFKVDPTCEEPCTIEISTETSPVAKGSAAENEYGINESFFRNIYSYLDDCTEQGITPSLPQLALFLHNAEVSLAFPGPRWLANPLSYLFGLILGVFIGEYVFGYKRSYPEYYNPALESSKKTK